MDLAELLYEGRLPYSVVADCNQWLRGLLVTGFLEGWYMMLSPGKKEGNIDFLYILKFEAYHIL